LMLASLVFASQKAQIANDLKTLGKYENAN
jgi:hypothetical protein